MSNLSITRRPIVLETQASGAMLTEILGRIATIRGRASRWGVVNDTTLAELLTGGGIEADFTLDYYRTGFVEGFAPAILPGWSFTGGGGTSLTSGGRVVKFAPDEPRITDRGLLVERTLTNILPYSEDFSSWFATGASPASVVTNDRSAPDETVTADEISGVGNNSDRVQQAVAVAASTAYTASIFVRNVSAAFSEFHVATATAVFSVGLTWTGSELVAASLSANSTVRSVALADGWYLVSQVFITGAGDAGSATVRLYPSAEADPAVRAIHAWGADLKEINRLTSYVPTGASAATRAADVAQLDLDRALAYPLSALVEFERNADSGSAEVILELRGIDGNNTSVLLVAPGNSGRVRVFKAGNTEANLVTAEMALGEPLLLATRLRGDDVGAALDGALSTTDTSAATPALVRWVAIGSAVGGGDFFEGYIRRVVLMPAPLTDAQLQIATT